MFDRLSYQEKIELTFSYAPVCAVLGPRQCGKSTLAHLYAKKQSIPIFFFDLEKESDLDKLQDPLFALGELNGLIVIDEIQRRPELFPTLRHLVDYNKHQRYLILGSASAELIRQSSETLAGRIGYIELPPLHLLDNLDFTTYMSRGGFPRSYLAANDIASYAWRQSYIKTFLEKDIPSFGFTIASSAIRRFWTMLSHVHGQIFNASDISASLGISYKTAQHYLDILESTFMIRRLQPWFENLQKRQVKTPKIYFRDHGVLQTLMGIENYDQLYNHVRLGAVWEGLAMEEIISLHNAEPQDVYFWATHGGVELDLMIVKNGKKLGFEFKYAAAPKITKSIHIALADLQLDHVTIVTPTNDPYALAPKITVEGLTSLCRKKNSENIQESSQQPLTKWLEF